MSVLGSTSISLEDEQAMLMDVAREFVRDKSPIEAVRKQLETATGFDPEVWAEMVKLGWTGIALPESLGGSELGIGAVVPLVEALGNGLLGTPLISTTLAGQLLLRTGDSKAGPFLERIAAGEVATVAFLDGADWGADNIALELTADGGLEGSKRLVGDATVAGLFVVPAQRNGEPVLAVVDAASLDEGSISANTLIDLTKRSANVDFSGVTPSLVIQGPSVEDALWDFRLLGSLLVAAEAAGTAARCLRTVIDYLTTRKQFGKLIGSYQALKHPTVDMYCAIEDTRSFVYHAATLVGSGHLDEQAEIACRMAKAKASDTMSYCGDRSVQFHGGIGFTWDCDTTLFIRRAQWTRQAFGDSIHHRKNLAALLLDEE